MDKKEVKIAIAGLGTVGSGVVKLLSDNRDIIAKKTGGIIPVVSAVSASDKNKDRGIDISGFKWYDNVLDISGDTETDIVVEAIGGDSGFVLELCEASLRNKKHFVTANKALIANHGMYLTKLAEENKVNLMFEASVGGGMPVINLLKNSMIADRILRVSAILNGTCNYILSSMKENNCDFSVALKEAQRLGYAEAEPSLDIEGIDTAHKLAIISSLVFTKKINYQSVYTEGITDISIEDIKNSEELGYEIKLLAKCFVSDQKIMQSVYPALISKESPIAGVSGVDNALLLEGDPVGSVFLMGPGAGQGATASAVVSDIVNIISSDKANQVFNCPYDLLEEGSYLDIDSFKRKYYISFTAKDKNQDILNLFAKSDILLSYVSETKKNNLVVLTKENSENNILSFTNKVYENGFLDKRAKIIRVE